MGSAAVTIFGSAVLALLAAGYFAQKYLPPPKPKIVGIDLGTTYSCVGMYHAVTGQVDVIPDAEGHKCIPSIVAFSNEGVVVGYKAAAQAEKNPLNTIYDAKRFIGKKLRKHELHREAARYPFKLELDEYGMARYVVDRHGNETRVRPEEIGAHILRTLKQTAETNITHPVTRVVISVPAEFDEIQRNFTRKAAEMAGLEVFRIINEPTAAALAYGLHKKDGVSYVLVVDLGGGTLDVSLLYIQGGMFLTQAMAGNNHLGGQDFNQKLLQHLIREIQHQSNKILSDPEDMQTLRNAVEEAKIRLTTKNATLLKIPLHSIKTADNTPFWLRYKLTRAKFEELNMELFEKVLLPITRVLEEIEMSRDEIDEVVLVGGSTRIPKVREIIRDYFHKEPNVAIDPELAVASGVSIQAGILGGMWPLTVSATELPTKARKIILN